MASTSKRSSRIWKTDNLSEKSAPPAARAVERDATSGADIGRVTVSGAASVTGAENVRAMAAGAAPVAGVLLVDKSEGMTSHDVVAAVRRLTGVRKVGHGGTLDPFATGLLLMLVGKATRLFDLLAPLTKEYVVTVQFGAVSTTGDIDGELTPVPGSVEEEGLRAVLPRFTGRITQRVPAYSAVKQDGERLYKKARRGEVVELPLREVEIHGLELLSFHAASQQAQLRVNCSKGTYIRTLAEDIGEALGGGAHAAALRRTAIGDLSARDASTVDRLAEMSRGEGLTGANPSFLSCVSALYFLPVNELDAKDAAAVKNGRFIAGDEAGPVLLTRGGGLLAVYGPSEQEGIIRPLVVMA